MTVSSSPSDFQGFFDRLNRALREYTTRKAQFDLEHAPMFSGFDALLPNERSLSCVFAYLFDESAGHGQRDAFLSKFLGLIRCPKQDFRTSHVYREYPTGNGRFIDIVLALDEYRIGIENKPWAREGDNQCFDYCKELERLAKEHKDQWMLVFLTADGRKCETGGCFTERTTPLRYDKLAEVLTTECAVVQPFLKDFRRFVQQWIYGEAACHPKEKEMIEEFLRAENLEVTLEIVAQLQLIRQEVVARFRDALLTKVRGEFGSTWQTGIFKDGRPLPDFNEKWSGLYLFKPVWKDKFAIGFSNARENAADMGFGVYYWGRNLGKQFEMDGLDTKLNEEFALTDGRNAGRKTDHWGWWLPLRPLRKPMYPDDWYSDTVLKKMALDRGAQMVEDLFPLVAKTITKAAPLIDQKVREEIAQAP
jgi:hypothetical protein